METKKYEYKNNEGSLWPETNCTVVDKGIIKIEDKEHYASIIKYKNKDGTSKLELAISIGLLRINEEAENNTSAPNIKGGITWKDKKYGFACWRNISTSGVEWKRIKLKETDEKEQEQEDEEQPF
tara:strand:+ start:191 stop:565 length:375 start_codon:yes stop_codon:yes gene_type:complete